MTATAAATTSWKRCLLPYKAILAYLWSAISFQSSPVISLGTYAAVFCIFLIPALLFDGTLIQLIGLILLFISLCYGIVLAAANSCFGLDNSLNSSGDQDVILDIVSGYLANMEHTLLSLLESTVKLRSQQPVMFYAGGGLLVVFLGQLGHWMSIFTITWISIILLLTVPVVPVAVSRGWISAATIDRLTHTFEHVKRVFPN